MKNLIRKRGKIGANREPRKRLVSVETNNEDSFRRDQLQKLESNFVEELSFSERLERIFSKQRVSGEPELAPIIKLEVWDYYSPMYA